MRDDHCVAVLPGFLPHPRLRPTPLWRPVFALGRAIGWCLERLARMFDWLVYTMEAPRNSNIFAFGLAVLGLAVAFLALGVSWFAYAVVMALTSDNLPR